MFCCCCSVERLTDVIDKVKKEIILKGSSQSIVPKANLSAQVEALVKATFGRFCQVYGGVNLLNLPEAGRLTGCDRKVILIL